MLEEFEFNEFEEHRARDSAREFERMLHNQEYRFIDLIKVDEIYHYYVRTNELSKAQELVRYAIHSFPSSSDLYSKQARLDYEMGKFEEALSHIETALHYSPMMPEYLMFKADLLARMDRYDEAMALLEGLQYTFEPREEVLIQMGNVAQICGHVEDSERYYRQALTLVPAFEDALFELAFLLESEDRTDEALVLYETYLDERPYAAMVWHNLGLLYRKLGNYEKALEAFDFALAIVPEMAPAWFNRGELLMDQGRIAEAVQAFIETHAISSHDPMTQYRIAECFEALEMYRDAIRFYRKAAISDPDYLDAYVGIGFCLEKLEQFTEAIHYYQKAHRIDSENAEISLAIATCEYRLGNHHSAYLFLGQAIVLEPQDVNIWQDWAMLLFEHDNVSGAISFLEEGIKANPREAVLYYQCAAYCYLNQAFDQGATYLENALLLDVEARHILFQIVPAIRLFPGVEDLIQHYRNL